MTGNGRLRISDLSVYGKSLVVFRINDASLLC